MVRSQIGPGKTGGRRRQSRAAGRRRHGEARRGGREARRGERSRALLEKSVAERDKTIKALDRELEKLRQRQSESAATIAALGGGANPPKRRTALWAAAALLPAIIAAAAAYFLIPKGDPAANAPEAKITVVDASGDPVPRPRIDEVGWGRINARKDGNIIWLSLDGLTPDLPREKRKITISADGYESAALTLEIGRLSYPPVKMAAKVEARSREIPLIVTSGDDYFEIETDGIKISSPDDPQIKLERSGGTLGLNISDVESFPVRLGLSAAGFADVDVEISSKEERVLKVEMAPIPTLSLVSSGPPGDFSKFRVVGETGTGREFNRQYPIGSAAAIPEGTYEVHLDLPAGWGGGEAPLWSGQGKGVFEIGRSLQRLSVDLPPSAPPQSFSISGFLRGPCYTGLVQRAGKGIARFDFDQAAGMKFWEMPYLRVFQSNQGKPLDVKGYNRYQFDAAIAAMDLVNAADLPALSDQLLNEGVYGVKMEGETSAEDVLAWLKEWAPPSDEQNIYFRTLID
ncbi:MAG: hypothetical protein R3F11_14915 [Verrucomicrobiales bacterium]